MILSQKLGILGVGLCALCCALPIAGTVLGVSVFSALAVYLEKAGIVVLLTSAGIWVVWLIRKKRAAPACEIDCSCKPDQNLHSNPKMD